MFRWCTERIAIAHAGSPEGHFLAVDALALRSVDLPPFRHIFIHGLLHHLDDAQTHQVTFDVLSLAPNVILVVMEPFCPDRWFDNPRGFLLARDDEGSHVRTFQERQRIFGPMVNLLTTRRTWPRWPVGFVVARMISTKGIANASADRAEFEHEPGQNR